MASEDISHDDAGLKKKASTRMISERGKKEKVLKNGFSPERNRV